MKMLTLLRHAKAVDALISVDDFDRALTDRGRKAAEQVTRGTNMPPPQLILCSSARRTVETFDAVSAGWPSAPASRIEKTLYLASAATLLSRIEDLDDNVSDVWLIGHNPGLHDLARQLATRAGGFGKFPELAFRFPTSGLAVLQSDAMTWGQFSASPLTLVDVKFRS